LSVDGVAFDREQQLMKLPAHAALSPAIVEVAEGTFETAECPVQRKFGVLFHFRPARWLPSSMPAHLRGHSAAPAACQF
jgi:hypothetical protein